MDAGRELDALVAEKVMGWVNVACLNGGNTPTGEPDDDWNRDARNDPRHGGTGIPQVHRLEVPDYSTQINDAWEVVEKLKRDGWNVSLGGDNGWGCTIYKIHAQGGKNFSSTWEESFGPINAETAPLAICLAALKAVGYDVVQREERA